MNQGYLNYLIASALLILSFSLNAQTATRHSAITKLIVNTNESKVIWIGKKPTGEHTGYVKLSGGELVFDKKEIAGGSFIIDLTSIVDLDLNDEGMNKMLVGHLKSADFFNVEKYPTAKFTITKVSKHPGTIAGAVKATHRIEGDLTIKGITRKVSFDASINLFGGKLTASTLPFIINRTLWGVNYQSKSIFAELKDKFIYDDITLSVELVSN